MTRTEVRGGMKIVSCITITENIIKLQKGISLAALCKKFIRNATHFSNPGILLDYPRPVKQ